jgi:hypothetical protein
MLLFAFKLYIYLYRSHAFKTSEISDVRLVFSTYSAMFHKAHVLYILKLLIDTVQDLVQT